MKEQIYDFIKTKTPYLLEVLSVKIKDYNDEHGIANEHYIVECVLATPDTSIPIMNYAGRANETCLVDVSQFNNWLKSEQSIKWVKL